MTYVYRFAGENLDLAEAELRGFLTSKGLSPEVERKGRIGFTKAHPSQLRRLALVHEVSEVLERDENCEIDFKPEGSFAVRAYDLGADESTKDLEKKVGRSMETSENQVNLENPEQLFNLYALEEEYILAREVLEIDRSLFNRRKNQNRPFSSPVSLDPDLARVLVNLTEVPVGGKILDPFCGTGGILIEAGLCGIKSFGADVQEEMVEGARENMEEYGVLNHDIRHLPIDGAAEEFEEKFDAVVADLPYGKASKTEGDPVQKFLELAPKLTDRRVVFMYNEAEVGDYEADFEIYVHKNLTRYIFRV